MQVVNGYLCRDCADVARAKKGIDPAHASHPAGSSERQREHAQAATLATQGDVGTRLHVIA
jgi:hypothetical protein